jgi:hypothetical protein
MVADSTPKAGVEWGTQSLSLAADSLGGSPRTLRVYPLHRFLLSDDRHSHCPVQLANSASPNLLPGSIVANGSQEYMDADYDDQGSKGEQAYG